MTSTFELLPAIDLRGGRVVRLRQGDFARETAYSDDPVRVARGFADAGAAWIHVVDLDGARAGEPRQLGIAADIAAATTGRLQVELGGGLRSTDAVAGALDAGVARVVVGTAALGDPLFAARIVERHGAHRIVAAIDVRDGLALGEGWRQGSTGIAAGDAVTMLAAAGVTTFEVTAVDHDGLLGGPDLALLRALVALDRGRIIGSGGVSSRGDVLAVQASGCGGAIVGRAIYEGWLDLAELLRALGTDAPRP